MYSLIPKREKYITIPSVKKNYVLEIRNKIINEKNIYVYHVLLLRYLMLFQTKLEKPQTLGI